MLSKPWQPQLQLQQPVEARFWQSQRAVVACAFYYYFYFSPPACWWAASG
ncbi:hypothetical protein [Thermogemmatispora carboxidivorans]|nr:hypothetical protein [Thermogemmatispora carboxidivorans]